MAKKGVKKKKSTKTSKKIKKTVIKEIQTISEPEEKEMQMPEGKNQDKGKKTQTLLLDNFIALQGAITNIGYDLKDLNKKLSSLLELFETAAKSFDQTPPESKTISGKLDEIIEQNRTIAKSLLLLSKSSIEEKGDFKPSIKSETEEETEESANSDESGSETEETTEESSDSEEEFQPEPLPEFNF